MESLSGLLFIIFIAILFVIISSSVFKIHPFISLILACFIVGIGSGVTSEKIIGLISEGFGSILSYIGLIVALGTVIGVLLESSGALQHISDGILSLFGQKKSVTAMAILGSVVGIPVFCDSGFIILSRLSKMVAKRQGISTATTSLALASGLYTTHTLVPPTPGPIAAAGNIGAAEHLGLIILVGFFTAIPVTLISIWFAQKYGKDLAVEEDFNDPIDHDSAGQMSFTWAITPILLPILLITASSIFRIAEIENGLSDWIHFLGNPLISLLAGLMMAILQISPKMPLKNQSELIGKGLIQAGPILLITGAGGAFGSVLKATPLTDLLSSEISNSVLSGVGFLILTYCIAALIKTAQGSSTSALVITSTLLAPFTQEAGFSSGFEMALVVMALGAGAMTVSHTNDSYFWIVTRLSGFSLKAGYRGFTLMTLVQGITVMICIILMYMLSSNFTNHL